MPNNDYANAGDQSRAERILSSIINGTEYDEPVQSRLEYLLLQLLGTLDAKADLDEDGLIPVSEIPPQAFEYMVDVADDTARFALTTDDVQKGDIVRVISTGIMYIVVDETHLDSETGYKPFGAGIAAKAIGDEDGNNIKQTYQTKINNNNKLGGNVVDLTGYTPEVNPSTWATPASTDTVDDAIKKLDNNTRIDKTNILSIEQANGKKNLIPYPYASGDNYTSRDITFTSDSDGVIHITGANDGTGNVYYALIATAAPKKILKNGETYTFTIEATGTGTINQIYINQIASSTSSVVSIADVVEGKYENDVLFAEATGYTGVAVIIKITSTNTASIDMYLKIMLDTKAINDIDDSYAPYAMSNYELTQAISQNNTKIDSIPRCDMDRLPITFTANSAGNLKGYTIFGNADKVGEQTVNLFDKANADVRDDVYPDGTTGEVKSSGVTYTVTIAVEPSTTYTISKNTSARRRVAGYSTYPNLGDSGEFVTETYTTVGTKQVVTFTTTANTHYIMFFFSASALTTEQLNEILNSIQLETGSTMTDYEPYGYKIPITCGGVTTNLYCDSQLDSGDMLSMSDFNTNIPVISGSNTITTTLTNKPTMWIKYE